MVNEPMNAPDNPRQPESDATVHPAAISDPSGQLKGPSGLHAAVGPAAISAHDRLRQYVAVMVGAVCLAVAAVVVAAEGDAKSDPAAIERHREQGRAHIDAMHKMISTGFAELEEARKSSNITRVNCVNDALTTMKGLLRLAESNYTALQECASRKDSACAEHEYVKISIAYNKFEELDGQLKGCGGPSLDGAIDGQPYIEKSIDPDLPDIDPTKGLTEMAPSLENPPAASPFFIP